MKIPIPSFSRSGPRGAAHTNIREHNFIVALPHASADFPDWSASADEFKDRERHEFVDIGSLQLGVLLSRALGASLITAKYSRLLVDLNRDVLDPTAITKPESGITEGDLAARLRIHDDYHGAIASKIAEAEKDQRQAILIDLHSFTRIFNGEHRTVDIGVVSASENDEAADTLYKAMRAKSGRKRIPPSAGIGVRRARIARDQPYSGKHPGAFTGRKYGEQGKIVVTLEVCDDLLRKERQRRAVCKLIASALIDLRSELQRQSHDYKFAQGDQAYD